MGLARPSILSPCPPTLRTMQVQPPQPCREGGAVKVSRARLTSVAHNANAGAYFYPKSALEHVC